MADIVHEGMSLNSFAERALREFVLMADEAPGNRAMPELIRQLDFLRLELPKRLVLPEVYPVQTPTALQLNETPPSNSASTGATTGAEAAAKIGPGVLTKSGQKLQAGAPSGGTLPPAKTDPQRADLKRLPPTPAPK